MSMRIGLAVASDSVRMVAVRDERILWAGESPLDAATPIERAAGKLLGEIPLPRWPRARVIAAIGPAQSQVKRLTGLPPVADARVVAQLVRESPGRFFLKNGIPLATTGVRLVAAGDAWGAALDEPVVRAIADVCRQRRVTLRGVVPTVLVLGRSLEDARVVWHDGDVSAELTLSAGALEAIRRVPMGSEHGEAAPEPRAALRALGGDAWRFADAYAAAMTDDDEPLAVRPGRAAAHEASRVPRWRLALAAAALALAMLAALIAPGLAGARAGREAERTLRAIAGERAKVVRDEADLRDITSALNEAAAFHRSRRSPVVFLASLADLLPPTAQLVAVRLDTAGGNLVALAPRAGDVISRLERLDGVEAPEAVGPVTREYVGQQEKERVTVRFRWRTSKEGRR